MGGRKQARLRGDDTYTGGKECKKCGSTVRNTSSGNCVSCNRERAARRSKSLTSEEVFANNLKWRYGLLVEQYEEMKEQQRGCCKICMKPKPLVVDHCHETNEVRGLICQDCNKALGFLYDDPLLFDRCVLYLQRKL